MLSGETTVGKQSIAGALKCSTASRRASSAAAGANFFEDAVMTTARQKLVKSAVVMANELKAAAILVFTRHGTMARHTGMCAAPALIRRFTRFAPWMKLRAEIGLELGSDAVRGAV